MVCLNLIFTKTAFKNLSEIVTYYEKQQKNLGTRFAKYHKEQTEILQTMPNIGRTGKVFGTRELVFYEFPYVVVYRVRKIDIQIIRIYHQSKKYPS
jgi:toxin ParE1/3/4